MYLKHVHCIFTYSVIHSMMDVVLWQLTQSEICTPTVAHYDGIILNPSLNNGQQSCCISPINWLQDHIIAASTIESSFHHSKNPTLILVQQPTSVVFSTVDQ